MTTSPSPQEQNMNDEWTTEAVEVAAVALYEASRSDDYRGSEYDWPNIGTAYDKPDEDETDPEWLRNQYRGDASTVLAAALPIIRRRERERIAKDMREQFRVNWVAMTSHTPGDVVEWFAARIAQGES
jgi:hypothetical protein